MDLGSRILAWLRAKGMTQKALAVALDVSPGAVTAWVKPTDDAAHSNPTQQNLEAIARALGLSMAKFYGPVPKAKKPARRVAA